MRAIESLNSQVGDFSFEVFLADDGSNDGTSQSAIELLGERLNIIRGSGDWYWAQSMYQAEVLSKKYEADFTLWLNDDVELYPGAISRLLDVAEQSQDRAVVVGSIIDENSKLLIYGGIRVLGPGLLRQRVLLAGSELELVDTFHGNCVLIPRSVTSKAGGIDGGFEHGLADIDFGLRCKKLGIAIICDPIPIAQGETNPLTHRQLLDHTISQHKLPPIWNRKRLPPKSAVRLFRRHSGFFWMPILVFSYMRGVLLR
jgi:GT2 family glycosyltransferase